RREPRRRVALAGRDLARPALELVGKLARGGGGALVLLGLRGKRARAFLELGGHLRGRLLSASDVRLALRNRALLLELLPAECDLRVALGEPLGTLVEDRALDRECGSRLRISLRDGGELCVARVQRLLA